MRKNYFRGLMVVTGIIMIGLVVKFALADDDFEQRKRDFNPISNPAYAEQCGECHFVYPPEMLPAESWRKILAGLPSHNEEEVIIEADARESIAQYLEANAAEKSTAKRARKIMKSLAGQAPTRITEVPYIRDKHDDLPPHVFKRQSIGSFSNCPACHTTAEKGIFSDDFVQIPE